MTSDSFNSNILLKALKFLQYLIPNDNIVLLPFFNQNLSDKTKNLTTHCIAQLKIETKTNLGHVVSNIYTNDIGFYTIKRFFPLSNGHCLLP